MSQLTEKIKAKYPQYANIPDAQLEQRVLAKYPQYKPLAGKTVGGFVKNVGKSGIDTITGIGSSIVNIANPDMEKNTLANLGRVGVGAAQLLLPGEQGLEQNARNVGNFYKQRYGGVQNIKDTLYNDPVGSALDVSTLLGGAGALTRGAGAATKASGLTRAGNTLTRAGAAIDPIAAVGRGFSSGVSKATQSTGKALDSFGKDYAIRGYGQPQKLAKFGEKFRPAQEVISEYGLYGKDTGKLEKVISDIQQEFDDIARNSGRKVTFNDILIVGKNKADELRNSGFTEDITIANQLEDKLNAFINANLDANPNMSIDIGDVTRARVGYDKRVRDFATDPTAKGSNQLMRDILQEQVRKSAKGLKTSRGEDLAKTGKRLNELYQFKPIMEQAASRGTSVRAFPFGRTAAAIAGGQFAGAPGVIAAYALDAVGNNPKVMGAVSKGSQVVGKNLRAAKLPVKVKSASSSLYGVGKSGRVLSPFQNASTSTQSKQLVESKPVQTSKDIVPQKNVFKKKPVISRIFGAR